jgi:membrane protein implicated in regulation of membrane protease activity
MEGGLDGVLTHWTWWIIGAVLVILEVFAPGAVFLWMGVAAGVVGVVVLIFPGLGWEYQLIVFAVLAVASIAVFRRYLKTSPIGTDRPTLNRRGSQYIGRVFTLGEPIVDGRGRLHVDDTMWKIEGPDLSSGTQVRVTGIDGVVLKVEAAGAAAADGRPVSA